MSPRKARSGVGRRIVAIALAALTLTIGGLGYSELHGNGRPPVQAEGRDAPAWTAPRSLSAMFDYQPTMFVVGESRGAAYPYLVADKMGWSLVRDGQGGTGFLRGGDNTSRPRVAFIDRLDQAAAAYHADYVLIDGGRNDLGEPPERVAAAADEYIRQVQSKWPAANVIVVLPASPTSDADPNYAALADGLRGAAQSLGAYVIDPVAQQWYREVDTKQLLSEDGVHFNANGETYYAQKIVENLKQMFGLKPVLLVVGDSFAAGTDTSFATYPQLVADKMGWDLALDAQGGTGFVTGISTLTPPHLPFIDRLDRDKATYRYRVDYILIDGGRNDLEEPPEVVAAAADEYIKKVHAAWPSAKILIVLPSYITPGVAPNFPALVEGLLRTVDSVGALVIDPVTQRWYHGIDLTQLRWRDDIHPNGKGETYYADKIIENLKAMGLAS